MDDERALVAPPSHAFTASFPTGLSVLVVDDDVLCLKLIDAMLVKSGYRGERARAFFPLEEGSEGGGAGKTSSPQAQARSSRGAEASLPRDAAQSGPARGPRASPTASLPEQSLAGARGTELEEREGRKRRRAPARARPVAPATAPGPLIVLRAPPFHTKTVTTASSGAAALELLRNGEQHVDLVLSDVYMPGAFRSCFCFVDSRSLALGPLAPSSAVPSRQKTHHPFQKIHHADMDGFRLLEEVGLELDLPVIMMSSCGEHSTVMRGVTHGACDFLIKPVRAEELRNVWQHVVRARRMSSCALGGGGTTVR